jgi:hypothetical protein
MKNENVRMQFLAGLITESQMRKINGKLNENEDDDNNSIPPNFNIPEIIKNKILTDKPKIYNQGERETEYTKYQQLKPNFSPLYDLGGGEMGDSHVQSPKNIIIGDDIEDDREFWDEIIEAGEVEDAIQHDLDEFIKLSPRKYINITSVLQYLGSGGIYKTIDHALSSGGIIVVSDYIEEIERFIKQLPSYKLIEINFIGGDDGDEGQYLTSVFQK